MDEEGIDLAILYPSRGLNALSIPNWNPSSPRACPRLQDWLYEFCQADHGKKIGAGMISAFDIDRRFRG